MPVTVSSDLCTRVRDTPAQVGKHADARQKNVRQAFALRNKAVPGQVVILDDVMTTGSTCAELARTLKTRGCAQVLVWCLARA
jgi:predicted amidophosphoribosyltransferase